MQNPLMQTIEALAKEKGIEADTIITAIEDAVLTASRKYYKTNEDLKTRFNQETGQVDLFAIKHIVQTVENPATEISLKEAQELSNRVGIIDHGELIALGTQKELTQQVGQTETLVLHIGESDDSAALAKSLEGIQDVLEANASDHEVAVITPEAEDILAAVVTKANERGIRIRSIDIREPNLEAVFLHLTGRALRD